MLTILFTIFNTSFY